MDITGKIIQVLPEVGGTARSGNAWRKREYVLETLDSYPKKVCFNFFGDRIDQYPVQVGQTVKLFFDLESREYNGRWYTDVRGWKIEDPNQAPAAPAGQAPGYTAPPANDPFGVPPMPQGGYAPAGSAAIAAPEGDDSSLPF